MGDVVKGDVMAHTDEDELFFIRGDEFEPSPYLECYGRNDIIYGVYAGRFFSVFRDEDIEHKYWTLRRTSVMYDVPERPVQIEGPDVVAFLEKIFARKVAALQSGRGFYAIACTPQGGVFMDGILFRLEEDKFWYVQPDGALETWLIAHSEGFDITISDPKSQVLQIQGPTSLDVMKSASNNAIDETMKYFQSGFYDLGGQEVYVSRTGWTGEMGWEIYSLGETTEHKRLWDHLVNSGAPHGMEVGSVSSMNVRRVEAGILNNISDIDMTMNPYEAGLGKFIDLEKEMFIGREALMNARREPLLFGLKCKTATPQKAFTVLFNGEVCGRITIGVNSPTLECGIGYIRFNRHDEWEGRMLEMQTPDGVLHACEVVTLPFYDQEKKIPRGIDKTIP